MRLYRPHVPLAIRAQVAERQMLEKVKCLPTNQFGIHLRDDPKASARARLDAVLFHLARLFGCEISELRLDHDPALAARPNRRGLGKKTYYIPDANDPDHLFYRPHGAEHAGSHLIKTNVRGDHGQHPDRVLIKKARRHEASRNREPRAKKKAQFATLRKSAKSGQKPRWPKRSFSRRKP
jgi:hypothetical protein